MSLSVNPFLFVYLFLTLLIINLHFGHFPPSQYYGVHIISLNLYRWSCLVVWSCLPLGAPGCFPLYVVFVEG